MYLNTASLPGKGTHAPCLPISCLTVNFDFIVVSLSNQSNFIKSASYPPWLRIFKKFTLCRKGTNLSGWTNSISEN